MVKKVGELIEGRPLYSTEAAALIADVCQELRDRNIGVLAVLSDGRLIGIVSERDVITRVLADGHDPALVAVGDVMTPEPITVEPDDSLLEALERMLAGGFRHLPVVVGDEPVGMISMRDIPAENRFLYQRYMEATQPSPALV